MIGVNNDGVVMGLHNDYWTLKRRNKEGFQQGVISLVSNRLGKDLSINIKSKIKYYES